MLSKREKKATIKLIDFGLSRQFFSYNDKKGVDYVRMETRAGTKLYMAPEVFTGSYSKACDMWSLGVILFIMVSSEIPFKGETADEIKESILGFRYDFDKPIWKDISEECKDLISRMLVEENQRITPKESLHHPWLKKFLFKKKAK